MKVDFLKISIFWGIYLTMCIILVSFLKIWLNSNYYIDLKKNYHF
jgi:hypothetical protein